MYFKPFGFAAVFVLLLAMTSMNSDAQTHTNRRDKIESLKIAFIAKKINLSPSKSQDFWPIYNEYDNAKQSLFRKYRRKYKSENLSMQDVEHRMEREKEFLDLRKKYINRFSKVLTPVQIADLKRSERQFKKLLLKRSSR